MKECAELFNCNQIDMKIREMAANFIANSIKAHVNNGLFRISKDSCFGHILVHHLNNLY